MDYWYYTIDIEGNPYYGETIWVRGEDEMIRFMMEYIDLGAGKTFDVYAMSFYEIIYDGNGGVIGDGGSSDNIQRIWNNDYEYIWDNFYVNGDAFFAGCNTRPDGSGESYEPGQRVYSEGHEAETLTLYAQWIR